MKKRLQRRSQTNLKFVHPTDGQGSARHGSKSKSKPNEARQVGVESATKSEAHLFCPRHDLSFRQSHLTF